MTDYLMMLSRPVHLHSPSQGGAYELAWRHRLGWLVRPGLACFRGQPPVRIAHGIGIRRGNLETGPGVGAQPRDPDRLARFQTCGTLAARFGIPDFVKQVVDSGMTGWYFRVLEPGTVRAGDRLELLSCGEVSVQTANQVMHHKNTLREEIENLLAQPALSQAWRDQLENRLNVSSNQTKESV